MRYEKIILKPLITEKADRQREHNCYQFQVAAQANKRQIRDAVQHLFNVEVIEVKTANYRGKPRQLGRSQGYKTGYKKAWVTVKEGQKIQVIEGV